jgi:hypothetical protein
MRGRRWDVIAKAKRDVRRHQHRWTSKESLAVVLTNVMRRHSQNASDGGNATWCGGDVVHYPHCVDKECEVSNDKRDKFPGETILNSVRARLSWAADQVPEPTALFGLIRVPGAGWGYAKAANRMVDGLSKEEAARLFRTLRWTMADAARQYAEERGWNVTEFLSMCDELLATSASQSADANGGEPNEASDASELHQCLKRVLDDLCAAGEITDVRMIKPGVYAWKIADATPSDASGEEGAPGS